jgi:hypothetical protein
MLLSKEPLGCRLSHLRSWSMTVAGPIHSRVKVLSGVIVNDIVTPFTSKTIFNLRAMYRQPQNEFWLPASDAFLPLDLLNANLVHKEEIFRNILG